MNGPIGDRLIAEFHLNAAQLGLLTSAYFLTFSAFQLPLGILIDHLARAGCNWCCASSRLVGPCCSRLRIIRPR